MIEAHFTFFPKIQYIWLGGKSKKIEYLKMIENILVFPYMYLVKKMKMWKNRKVNRTNLLLQCYYIKTKNTKVFHQSKQWKTSIFYLPLFPPNQIDQSIEESAGVTTPFNLLYKCVLTTSNRPNTTNLYLILVESSNYALLANIVK